ncbi:MAG: hybrid sensor histidine kinase/response regulator [Gallionellaceae bacterium]|nr:hybrid sensor histidine kinase/response regulator [Gallionellaceae bacterium]
MGAGTPPARAAGGFHQSLRFRILLLAILPMLAVVGLFATHFARNSITVAEQQLRRQGQEMARHLAEAVAFDLFSGNLPYVKRLLDFERSARQAVAVGIAEDGQWLLVSGQADMLPALVDLPAASASPSGQLLYFTHPVGLPGSTEQDPYLELSRHADRRAVVVAVLSRGLVEETRARVLRAALVMAGLALLLALVLAWRLALRLSRPLHDITHTVAQLADGGLAVRAPQVSSGELGLLERGVNRMAEALQESQRDLEQRVLNATSELRSQKEAAEAAVLAKSRFLAAASHDLRQPLHALTLLIAALRERTLDGEARRLVEHIDDSAGALEGLLNALLDLSKLDAGVVTAHMECFPAQRTLDNLSRQFAPLARAKGLRLRIHRSAYCLQTDPVLLERILNNLVSNALRYTDRGGILVGLRRTLSGARFEVWDSGRGIPAAFRERIFEEYFQLENPERHRDKGLGLGLAIVARLARLLGSGVLVASTPGRGSCFRFQVACCQPPEQRAEVEPTAFTLPLAGTLVAFIDDDEQILEAMMQVFEQWGVEMAAGSEVEEVRDELRELGRAPDLILSDYRLRGGRTGIDAVRLLREAFGEDIPAALITGDTAPETIQAIAASGLALLHKPLKPAKLRALLSHLRAGL